MVACIIDSPRETARDGNASSLVQCAADATDDASVKAMDGAADALDQAAAKATDEAAANGVDWSTQFVELHADDFRITVAGKEFLGQTSNSSLHSDPGTADAYTTLERTWIENGVEMRLFMYFYSDGTDWWAGEIRIYDGQPKGEWLTAIGKWFQRPLGQPFTGDFNLTLEAPAGSAAVGRNTSQGRLTMHGLQLQAFLTPEE